MEMAKHAPRRYPEACTQEAALCSRILLLPGRGLPPTCRPVWKVCEAASRFMREANVELQLHAPLLKATTSKAPAAVASSPTGSRSSQTHSFISLNFPFMRGFI